MSKIKVIQVKEKYSQKVGIWLIKKTLKGMNNEKLIAIKEMVNAPDNDLKPKQQKELNFALKKMFKQRGMNFEE